MKYVQWKYLLFLCKYLAVACRSELNKVRWIRQLTGEWRLIRVWWEGETTKYGVFRVKYGVIRWCASRSKRISCVVRPAQFFGLLSVEFLLSIEPLRNDWTCETLMNQLDLQQRYQLIDWESQVWYRDKIRIGLRSALMSLLKSVCYQMLNEQEVQYLNQKRELLFSPIWSSNKTFSIWETFHQCRTFPNKIPIPLHLFSKHLTCRYFPTKSD